MFDKDLWKLTYKAWNSVLLLKKQHQNMVPRQLLLNNI